MYYKEKYYDKEMSMWMAAKRNGKEEVKDFLEEQWKHCEAAPDLMSF